MKNDVWLDSGCLHEVCAMVKLVGAALCFLTSFLIGIFAGKNERERTAQCEAFLELFEYVKNQVGFFLAPTKLIYKSFDNEVLAETGFLAALSSHENDEVYFDAWQTALDECRSGIKLNKAQYEIVRAFGACIGKSNEQLQMKNFDYYIKMMTAETEKQKAEMAKNIKLYRTIGFTVGAAIAILVI
ncbi:MAG: stage III sporulation protein AB [Clostridiales bacterium]|nr:stage III sporulation protein AB [Clostridiales bacterium]